MLVKVLKELNEYNNIVVTLNPQNHFGDEFACDEYYCLNMGSFAKFPLAVFKLRRFINKHKIDIVHSHLFSATLVARLATPGSIPIITTIHTNVSTNDYKKWYLQALEKFSYKMHKSIIVGVSTGVMEQYFRFFNHKPYKKYLLYTFVDIDELKNFHEQRRVDKTEGMFTLVAIGALRYPKNQQYLIRAFELLKNEKFELHIYGIGAMQEEIKRLVKEAGVNIILKGEVKNASSLLPQYDLYVMPSEFEGFSLSVLEAMAMEIPMLLSDIPSFREQCADTAVYFDLNNIGDFITKLKQLAADESLRKRIAADAKQRVVNNFTLRDHIKGLRKIYTETLNTD